MANNTVTNDKVLASHGPEETHRLGSIIGKLAKPGDVVLLIGKLGAGKTCLARGIAAGLGSQDCALSPSFVIMRQYEGRLPLYHIDLYRLENTEEIADLGLGDYFYGKGVSVVEWAERAFHLLPQEHLRINIEYGEGQRRYLGLIPRGRRFRALAGEAASLYSGAST